MRFSTLAEWLRWQEQLHPEEIELGLERVSLVFRRLHGQRPKFKVFTVAGTNGKGSSVAMLDASYALPATGLVPIHHLIYCITTSGLS